MSEDKDTDRCESCAELQAIFDLQWRRMGEATKYWQEKTGRTTIHPDLGDMLHWFIERVGYLERKLAAAREAALLEAANLATQPYSDEVEAYGNDEPSVVGKKIAAAIRRLAALTEAGEQEKK